MKRLLPLLCVAAAAGVVATIWLRLSADAGAAIAIPKVTPPTAVAAPLPDAAMLLAARRSCRAEALDPVIAQLTMRSAASGEAATFRTLAEALLERILLKSHRRGMQVGTPTWSALPPEVEADIERGLAAALRAREAGDTSSEPFRLEAALLSQRITGFAAALQWNGRIQEALEQALRKAPEDPRLQVAVGLRKLLAPRLLGHDPDQALRHFEFAATALPDDERPAVFAAMASHLQQKRMQAIGWLEQAVARNPENTFAKVVLQRLRAGEDDPFGRDVTAAEGGS
jgi:tetratricopeptide (TPR) repeat protein